MRQIYFLKKIKRTQLERLFPRERLRIQQRVRHQCTEGFFGLVALLVLSGGSLPRPGRGCRPEGSLIPPRPSA